MHGAIQVLFVYLLTFLNLYANPMLLAYISIAVQVRFSRSYRISIRKLVEN